MGTAERKERRVADRFQVCPHFREEFEEEQRQMKEKLVELENENIVLKKRLSENGTDLFEMRSKLSKVAALEEELQFASEKLRREVEENHRLSRSRYEADRLKEENVYLKEEIERLTATTRQQNAAIPAQSSSKPSEDSQQLKIKELKTIIRMMSENYDDFCRSLKRNGNLYSSPVKVAKEVAGLRLNHDIPNTAEQVPKVEEQHTRDEVTPRAVAAAGRDSVQEIVQEPPPKPTELPSSNDTPFEVEDVQVDKPGASEDEIDW
ncbi:unnamed protein product [Cylicostephanus goldi]|uniref:Uncharacterized protein n=1 Tax=Cylicostephanus goldi TaxID=71465 RepID=A0A3P7M7N8_CYLGO|nr:unnamed protein product [Cylicostephanus goldi]